MTVPPLTRSSKLSFEYVSRGIQKMRKIESKFQPSISKGFGVMIFWRFGGKASVTDLINDGGVCRTTPATPGLLIICVISVILKAHIWPWRPWLQFFLISNKGFRKTKWAVKYKIFYELIFLLFFFPLLLKCCIFKLQSIWYCSHIR